MKKKVNKSAIKKKAWAEFSRYIRLKNADKNGMVTCYTCPTQKHWKEMQAGHGIGGRNNAVLFLEEVVRPQCIGCNMYANGRYAVFTRRLIDELGMKEYDRIVSLSNVPVQYKAFQYQEIYEKYKALVEEYED